MFAENLIYDAGMLKASFNIIEYLWKQKSFNACVNICI